MDTVVVGWEAFEVLISQAFVVEGKSLLEGGPLLTEPALDNVFDLVDQDLTAVAEGTHVDLGVAKDLSSLAAKDRDGVSYLGVCVQELHRFQ